MATTFIMGTTIKMRVALISTVLTTLILFVGVFPVVYNEDLTVFAITFRLFLTAFTFLFAATFGMLIAYIVRIRG